MRETEARTGRALLLAAAAVSAVTLWTFLPTLHYGFVLWDDDTQVLYNPAIRGLDWSHLRAMFGAANFTQRYQPLAWIGLALVYRFFGLDPSGYHCFNLLFHAADAGLLCWILGRLLLRTSAGKGPASPGAPAVSAALAAALWSISPLRVEAVANVSSWKYEESLFFLLCSALWYMRAVEAGPADGIPLWRTASYWICLLCFGCSVLTYSIIVGLTILPLLLDLYPYRRLDLEPRRWLEPPSRGILLEKLPFIAAAAAVVAAGIVVRYDTSVLPQAPPTLAAFGILPRLMQASYIWGYYLWRDWVPFYLSPVYTTLVSFRPWGFEFVASASAVILISILAARLRRSHPWFAVLWLGHLCALIPALGLTEHPHYPADRYSYVQALCWSAAAAGAVLGAFKKGRGRGWAAALAALILVFGAQTRRQERIWRNSVALFAHILDHLQGDPYRVDVYWRLGNALLERGDDYRGLLLINETLKAIPRHREALSYRGLYFLRKGDMLDAARDLSVVVSQRPDPMMCEALRRASAGLRRRDPALDLCGKR